MEDFLEIVDAIETRKLTRYNQQILERREPAYCLTLGLDLLLGQGYAMNRICMVEAAVDT